MARLVFDYTGHPLNVSVLEPLVGQRGTLALSRLTVEALDSEDYLIFAGVTSDGTPLDDEQCRRLFSVPASVNGAATSTRHRRAILRASSPA